MEKWPSFLPNPSTSFKLSADANAQRTKMTSGYVRQRPLSPLSVYGANISWEFEDAEFEAFKAFIEYGINKGLDWFECDIPVGDKLTTHKVRIVGGKYKANYIHHMNWRVTITADVQEIGTVDQDYWSIISSPSAPAEGWYPLLDVLELCVNGRNF